QSYANYADYTGYYNNSSNVTSRVINQSSSLTVNNRKESLQSFDRSEGDDGDKENNNDASTTSPNEQPLLTDSESKDVPIYFSSQKFNVNTVKLSYTMFQKNLL